MHLIIGSRADPASMHMANHILENVSFSASKEEPDTYTWEDYRLRIIEERHLYYDTVSKESNGMSPDVADIVFLSSHSSSAQIKSLTVHPTGNFSEAPLGGKERTLSVSSPGTMTPALRKLNETYGGDGFEVTFEATHHGPLIDVPNYYIEIGTTEAEWSDPDALNAVKEAVFSSPDSRSPAFVGAGGGHYVPKITRYAMENGVSIGHLISKHAQDSITPEQIEEAFTRTPGCRGFIMDRKGCRGPVRAMISDLADRKGLEIIKL